MKLSVIIVNYNVKYFLEQTLLSVAKAMQAIDAEVFVVDNNSVDGSVGMLKKKFPQIHLIENVENKGFSKANNQAILKARGEYMLLLNPDTVVEEDTFQKIISFLDEHPDAGGLGVKMLDGSGQFLPESKRGLPTPLVAFYKIFGLSALFPKSRLFGKYHLGFLDNNKTHEVEILSGAFMCLRKKVLDQIGLLDEDYFMYGEDIDISYRIIKAGYKNYYFADTRIIHYKGESTKKSSINYVFVFYNAMIIFARKHFSQKNAALFSFLIRIAIYIRAFFAILFRFLKWIALPMLDFVVIYVASYFLKNYWEVNVKNTRVGYYPPEYFRITVPLYIITWLGSINYSGGYDRPLRLTSCIKGVFWGTIVILVIYALLPEEYRSSRALIILFSIAAAVLTIANRMTLSIIGIKGYALQGETKKRMLIVGDKFEAARVYGLLKDTDATVNYIGYVKPAATEEISDIENDLFLGDMLQLQDIIEVYKIQEVIFCAKNLSSQQIIDAMSKNNIAAVEYKIAPPESIYIIGSNSIHESGELYTVEINAINKAENARLKRLFDVLMSISLFLFSPIIIFIVKKPIGLFSNIAAVIKGRKSWIGYATYLEEGNLKASIDHLPKIKKGVLSPVDAIILKRLDVSTVNKLNMLYAKDYRLSNDVNLLLKGLKNLGRR